MLAHVVSASLALVPCEWHIDCSGWNGAVLAQFDVIVTGADGKVIKGGVEVNPGSTAEDARDALCTIFGSYELRFRRTGTVGLVLEGTAKAGVRSVKFVPKGWAPLVSAVPVLPKK